MFDKITVSGPTTFDGGVMVRLFRNSGPGLLRERRFLNCVGVDGTHPLPPPPPPPPPDFGDDLTTPLAAVFEANSCGKLMIVLVVVVVKQIRDETRKVTKTTGPTLCQIKLGTNEPFAKPSLQNSYA